MTWWIVDGVLVVLLIVLLWHIRRTIILTQKELDRD